MERSALVTGRSGACVTLINVQRFQEYLLGQSGSRQIEQTVVIFNSDFVSLVVLLLRQAKTLKLLLPKARQNIA
jgi:hypothetical protein